MKPMSTQKQQGSLGPLGGAGGAGGTAVTGHDTPLLVDALIRNRDAIAGEWVGQSGELRPLGQEDPANIGRWASWVRASVIDFEVFSRLGFSGPAQNGLGAQVWHVQVTGGDHGPPAVAYQPLVGLTRPGEEVFRKQLEFVNNYADLRPDRSSEILAQLGGPGAFLGSVVYLDPDRTRWTLELLAAALRLANHVEMRLKHALACRRPVEYSPQVQPMIATPAHGSLPSGHATESFAMAAVLLEVLREGSGRPGAHLAVQLMRLAARVAVNRTVAGVHFPVDSAAGAVLGLALGHYLVGRLREEDTYDAWAFDGHAYPGEKDFVWGELYRVLDAAGVMDTKHARSASPDPVYLRKIGPQRFGQGSPVLRHIWTKAIEEWA